MSHVRALLAELKPDPCQRVYFASLWLKFLVFFTFMFNSEHRGFSLVALNDEIFRSLLRPVYYSLVILILLAGLNAFAPRRQKLAFGFLNVLVTVLLLVDLWYYRAFRGFPALTMLKAYPMPSLAPAMVGPFLRWYDPALLADLMLLRWAPRAPAEGAWKPTRLLFQGGCFLGLILLVRPVSTRLGTEDLWARPRLRGAVEEAVALTPLGYHALEAASFLWHGGAATLELSGDDRMQIATWLDRNREALPRGPRHASMAGRNLLVIQVESLEYFVLDLVVDGQAVTPYLNALKRQGLCFTHFHEQVNKGVSSDADLMTNSSVYPVRNQPTFFAFPEAPLPSLPRVLARNGYECLSIHPDPGSVWNATRGLTNLGFQPCLDSGAFDCADTFGMGLSDASLFRQAEDLLVARKAPFYAFMVTLSSHMPFNLPEPLRGLSLEPSLEAEVMGDYFQSVHYTDQHLGRFLERLGRRGLLDRTVVVVTGDHQGVHKFYAEQLKASRVCQAWAEDPERRIPCLILAKGVKPEEVDVHGGQVDLMPTLLDLLGIDEGHWPAGMMGRNLLNTRRNLCVLADGTVLGQGASVEVVHCREGLAIADRLIRGNYLKRGDLAALH